MKNKINQILSTKILWSISFVLLLGLATVWSAQGTTEKEDVAYSLFVAEDNVALAENGGRCVRLMGYVHPYCGYQPNWMYFSH